MSLHPATRTVRKTSSENGRPFNFVRCLGLHSQISTVGDDRLTRAARVVEPKRLRREPNEVIAQHTVFPRKRLTRVRFIW